MNVNILNSGSSGNCAVIDDVIMIDAGWPCDIPVEAVFISHCHTDHIKHLDAQRAVPIYCDPDVSDGIRKRYPYTPLNMIYDTVVIRESEYMYAVKLWKLKHDVPCYGFDILRSGTSYADTRRIFFATDFSEIVEAEAFSHNLRNGVYDHVYIECNNTLSPKDFDDMFNEGGPDKDNFHKNRSYNNHCNVGYLHTLFTNAGFTYKNPCETHVTLLHKSSYYYLSNFKSIGNLCRIANILNPLT